ncbi:FtsX-like permease family protein [Streptomyces sp. NPDC057909]|uniref:FtsX-like permease family protein n=1 Tax=Streptomyces sp. NPDC057909 TaxID=3346277 RepID=UPI0036EA0DCE
MLVLALKTLRTRKGSLIGTFVALFLGSAVLSVCGILLESGLRMSQPPERYAAADVVVAGRQEAHSPRSAGKNKAAMAQPLVERVPVAADAARRLAAVAGVGSVVTDIGVPARVIGPGGIVLPGATGAPSTGHNWSSTRMGPYTLSGRAPAGDHQVVLDEKLAQRAQVTVGDTVSLMTRSRPQRFSVTGVVALHGVPSPRQSVVFFSDDLTKRLAAREGVVDAVGVLAAPGSNAKQLAGTVAAALGDRHLAVYRGQDRGQAEFLDVAATGSTLVLVASAVAGNVFLVTAFVVTSTLSLAMAHRRRETALLRAVGATPGQIRRMVTAEALTVAFVGGLLGWPVGAAVVHAMRDRLAAHGFVPPDFQPVIGPLPAAGAVVMTVLTASTAVLVAARRANRIRPVEALGEAALERPDLGKGRLITGCVLAAGAVAVFVTGLTHGGDFTTLVGLANSLVLVMVITAAVLGPPMSRMSLLVLAPLLRTSKVTGYLAAANHRAHLRRLAAAVTPLILAVSFAATVIFAQTTAVQAAREQMRDGMVAGHVLTAAEGVAPDVADEVRRLREVKSATGVVRTTIVATPARAGGELVSLSAQGVEPTALSTTMDLKPRAGRLDRLNRNTIALSAVASSELGRGLGDRVRLQLGDGTSLSPTVVAVYERGMGFADVTFDHDLLLAHTTSHLDASVLVRADADAHGTAAALAHVAGRYPGTAVQDPGAAGEQMRQQEANAWVNYLLAALTLVYAGVTVANTQMMNTAARRREFALLRLSGTTATQVMRMMRWESLAVVLAGVGIGTLASVPALVLVSLAVTNSPWPTVPPMVYLVIAGGTAALTVTAALLPTRAVLRTPPMEAIGSRD